MHSLGSQKLHLSHLSHLILRFGDIQGEWVLDGLHGEWMLDVLHGKGTRSPKSQNQVTPSLNIPEHPLIAFSIAFFRYFRRLPPPPAAVDSDTPLPDSAAPAATAEGSG